MSDYVFELTCVSFRGPTYLLFVVHCIEMTSSKLLTQFSFGFDVRVTSLICGEGSLSRALTDSSAESQMGARS